MKKLVGGVFLLCLTALTLTLSEDSETYTNITQPEILEQLANLKNYISNPSMIKPVWVQLKNGDEIVVVQGELKVIDTGEFEICVKLNGYKLVISIKFTQILNGDNEPLDDWYIDTNDAKYLFVTSNQPVIDLIESGTLNNAKPIYWHNIRFERMIDGVIKCIGYMIILNNSPVAIDLEHFVNLLKTSGFVGLVLNGLTAIAVDVQPSYQITRIENVNETTLNIIYYLSGGNQSSVAIGISGFTVVDIGVNKIN